MLNTQEFIDGYREAAAWIGPADGNGGWEGEWTPEAMESMRVDCENFIAVTRWHLEAALDTSGYNSAAAGHDFFLTRNRNGAGYWDRGLGKTGDVLTSAAHDEGSADVLVDDGGNWHHVS